MENERKTWKVVGCTFPTLGVTLNFLDSEGYMVFKILDNLEDDTNDLTIVAFDPVKQASTMARVQEASLREAMGRMSSAYADPTGTKTP